MEQGLYSKTIIGNNTNAARDIPNHSRLSQTWLYIYRNSLNRKIGLLRTGLDDFYITGQKVFWLYIHTGQIILNRTGRRSEGENNNIYST